MEAITNDAVIFGLLMLILGFVFVTSNSENSFWKKFYVVMPSLLMCYFLPSVFTTLGIIDPSKSRLYFVASRYLLPASLVLFTISVDLKEIVKLGPKALIMFLAGSVGNHYRRATGDFVVFIYSAQGLSQRKPQMKFGEA